MKSEEFVKKYSVERKNTASLKWDALQERFNDPELLPIWVADMEFKVPEAIQAALQERVNHGVFGYSITPDSYYEAFINWQQKRHHISLQKDWIRFSPGIVSALYWIVNAFTNEGDAVLIQTPVYYPFHNAVKDNKRKLIYSPLIRKNNTYHMDLADFEQKVISENVKLFILCNPANPAGRVWSEDELAAVLEICQKHNVLVISDEIHQDIILSGHQFISSLSVKNGAYHKNLIICTAPSKTFNLATLLNSHIIIPDADLRAQYDEKIKSYNQVELSVMGQIAAEAGYRHGEDWLEGLLATIETNYHYLKETLKQSAPKIGVTELEGTYLAFLDLSAYVPEDKTKEFIQDSCHLAVDFGEWFGAECKNFVRLNLATSPKNVQQAVQNISQAINQLENGKLVL